MEKQLQKEYENFMKDLVNKFSELCSVKMDYQDYCNYISEQNVDTRYSFWPPNERILIDMMIDGSFERNGVKEKILERQERAKKWLSENSLTYSEWVKKLKTNKGYGKFK
jgi:hypothetical protein